MRRLLCRLRGGHVAGFHVAYDAHRNATRRYCLRCGKLFLDHHKGVEEVNFQTRVGEWMRACFAPTIMARAAIAAMTEPPKGEQALALSRTPPSSDVERLVWVEWNPSAKVNVRLVDGWEEEIWAYQLNLTGEHHPTTVVALELPRAAAMQPPKGQGE